ncbi:MAG: alkaline phytoceramidase [Bacteroidota bacterium]|nr:alkaline phytoceramidase [Bacteroidota bacterium]
MQIKYKNWILPGSAIIAAFILLLIGPIAQNQEYHDFTDKRMFFGIPNFMDVITNIPFLFIGIAGLIVVFNSGSKKHTLKKICFTLFIGFVLLCFGSGYYHYTPSDFPLVFDRIPIAIIFMSFFSIFIYDYIGNYTGLRSFYFLNFIGIASVIYWYFSGITGNGDLRLYALVQFYPVIAIPLILIFYKHPFNYTREVILIFIAFGIAKITEGLDEQIYSITGFISGHSIKHIFMTIAGVFLVFMIKKRLKMKLN